jgi:hypothetical protein
MARKKIVTSGLGTDIAKVFEVTGVKAVVELITKDCGCKENEEKLNDLFPYRFKARCFTEEEYNQWKEFTEVRTLKITHEQILFISKLYSSVFNKTVTLPCSSCSPKPLIAMIDKLDKVYNAY